MFQKFLIKKNACILPGIHNDGGFKCKLHRFVCEYTFQKETGFPRLGRFSGKRYF